MTKSKWFWAVVLLVAGYVIGQSDERSTSSNESRQLERSSYTPEAHQRETGIQPQTASKGDRLQPTRKSVSEDKPASQQKVSVIPTQKLVVLPAQPKTPATAPITQYVDATRLNVRSGPSRNDKVIWTLKNNQAVQVIKQVGDWKLIQGPRFKGWVFATYLTNSPASVQPVRERQSQTSVARSNVSS